MPKDEREITFMVTNKQITIPFWDCGNASHIPPNVIRPYCYPAWHNSETEARECARIRTEEGKPIIYHN